MNENDIRNAMSRYKFYDIIQLTDNIATPGNPNHVPTQDLCMKHLKSLDLKGKRVLDIGCRDGLFSFAAESMGAEEVIGIDNDLSKPATEFLIPFFESKIQMVEMNLYDLKPDKFDLFDVVIFASILPHIRYPFWGLKVIRDVLKAGGHLLIETSIWKGEHNSAMLFCPTGEDSPHEPTSCTFFNEKGLVDTLTSMGFRIVEVEHMKRSCLYRLKNFVKQHLLQEKTVDGGLVHCTFSGYDEDLFTMQYWDEIHHFHTLRGG